MIGRVEVRLVREALRAHMREAVRRRVDARVADALADGEGALAAPDEKLTADDRPDGLSRDV